MATIRVGQGFFKKSLADAISVAQPSDRILIDPGVYNLPDGIRVNDIKLVGASNRADVVINSYISVKTYLHLENRTLKSTPYRNGICSGNIEAFIFLRNVVVENELSDKYLAIR